MEIWAQCPGFSKVALVGRSVHDSNVSCGHSVRLYASLAEGKTRAGRLSPRTGHPHALERTYCDSERWAWLARLAASWLALRHVLAAIAHRPLDPLAKFLIHCTQAI